MASIEPRPDGKWRARWREYPGGPQRSKHFHRKLDAEQHLVKTQHDLLTGSYVDPVKARTTVEGHGRRRLGTSAVAPIVAVLDRVDLPWACAPEVRRLPTRRGVARRHRVVASGPVAVGSDGACRNAVLRHDARCRGS